MAINFLNDGSFPDNAKLQFGDSQDLQIYHDGTDSYIDDSGTGDLRIRSNFLKIEKYTGETMATFNDDNAVTLYYDNEARLNTSSGGITVNGTNSDILFVSDGNDYNYLQVFEPDTVVNALGVSQSTVTIPVLLNVDGQATFNNGIEMTSGNFNAGDNERIRLGNSADLQMYHDGSNSYLLNGTADFYIDSNGDDLYLRASDDVIIQSQGSENAIYCTGNSGVQLYHNGSEKLETKSDGIDVTGNINFGTSDGDLEMSEGSHIVLNAMQSPLAGAEANGLVIKLHTSTTVFGKIYYKSHQAAAWSYANAGNDGTTRMLGLALGTSSSNDGMLLQGIIRIASHGLSAGAPLYVSTTNGEFTTTAPSSGGDYVRVVGYTIDSNTIYFNPSGTWVEVSN
jgi:hypothetical protein